ncbi:MAG: hypothetical protein H6760_00980 [Candidatus Nomurabacteria bacterium]|nr:MAG: hypothetical protein H6760_00980 [Candidatus Nomurabacteria bacterium]
MDVKQFSHSQKDERGIVMLLSLLVLSALTAVAIGTSVLIIKEVQQSSNIDRSLMAYYAAETGIEKGLYTVKIGRQTNQELADILNDLNDGGAMSNGASWSTDESTTSEEYSLSSLKENQSTVLDLYDPLDPTEGGYESFGVEALDAKPLQNPAWLEISYFPWTINGGLLDWDDDNVEKRLRSVYETQPNVPAIFDLLPNQNYRIRVRALYDDLRNVRITAFTEDDPTDTDVCNPAYSCIKSIPNRVLIRSLGASGGNQSALSASVPYQAPASGIFDFVLFSEQTIDKRT